MLCWHGSVQPESRASDVDADHPLATGPRWLQSPIIGHDGATPSRLIQRMLTPSGKLKPPRGTVAALSGLLLMAAVFMPLPLDRPAYAREITSGAVQTMATNNGQGWQPDPNLSNSMSSLFNPSSWDQGGQTSGGGQSQDTNTTQTSQSSTQSAAPASTSDQSATTAPAPNRVTASSRGGDRPTPDISTHAKFIAAVAQAAQASQLDSGVPASVTIAQAILESDWGQSLLAKRGQNYFGIKAGAAGPGPAGVISMSTWEVISGANVTVNDAFKAYHNLYESVMDHGRFLADRSRYAAAFQYVNDPREFARQIQAAGYATDPSYATKLINIMNSYDLYQYDLPQPGQ